MMHDQRMVLVEKLHIQAERPLKTAADGLVALPSPEGTDSYKKAPRVSIYDEHGPIEGVKQHVIRSFRTYAVDAE